MHESPTLLEPDDLATVPDGDSFELVDGRLVEKPMGMESGGISADLLTILNAFVRANRLGRSFDAQSGYRCFPNRPNLVRKPDVSFVARGRFPNDERPKGDSPIPPDLAARTVARQRAADRLLRSQSPAPCAAPTAGEEPAHGGSYPPLLNG